MGSDRTSSIFRRCCFPHLAPESHGIDPDRVLARFAPTFSPVIPGSYFYTLGSGRDRGCRFPEPSFARVPLDIVPDVPRIVQVVDLAGAGGGREEEVKWGGDWDSKVQEPVFRQSNLLNPIREVFMRCD